MRRKLAAGNWKMNGNSELLNDVENLISPGPLPDIDILLCPPATLLHQMSCLTNGAFSTGGQDCHAMQKGAHTGDISAEMLIDAGAKSVILGHSERRHDHQETDGDVQAKARAAITAGLQIVICVGESLQEREASNAMTVIQTQLAASIPEAISGDSLVVAYEPIWAIGTGIVATLAQIEEMHCFIRQHLIQQFGTDTGEAVRVLYGGSVKPENAAAIFAVPNVDGALVGGASLKATDFLPIITALGSA